MLQIGDKIAISEMGQYSSERGRVVYIESIPARTDGIRLIHCHLDRHPGITRHMEYNVMLASKTVEEKIVEPRDVDKYLDQQRDDIFKRMCG